MAYLGNTPTTQNFVSGTDYFNGTGSQTAFTLSRTVNSINDIQAVVNNVVQVPNDAYTLSGTTITFTSAPSSGTNNVYVRYLSTTTQVITPSQNSVGTAQLGTITNIASGNSSLTLQTGSSPTTALTINTAQKVGIGTTPSGSYILEVNGNPNFNSVGGVYLTCGTYDVIKNPSGNIIAFGGVTSSQWDTTALYTGGTERMRINSSGNLLVGATSTVDSERVNVTQSGQFPTIYSNNTNATNAYGIRSNLSTYFFNTTSFLYDGIEFGNLRFRVYSNGGIANLSGNDVNISDQREKKDIALAPNYLDKICQIPVKTFLYIDQTDTQKTLGVIAQDVQAIAPELVEETDWSENGDGSKMRLSIYQTDLQFALMKAIQELKAELDATKAEVQALKGVA